MINTHIIKNKSKKAAGISISYSNLIKLLYCNIKDNVS